MLSLTRKTDYALVALAHMARHGAGKVCARDLSERVRVPVRILTNVLNRLTRYGYLNSIRGTSGGYCLARSPSEITVRDVVEVMEGPVRLARCCGSVEGPSNNGGCRRESGCEISAPIKKLHLGLRSYLGQVTIHDLAWDMVALETEPFDAPESDAGVAVLDPATPAEMIFGVRLTGSGCPSGGSAERGASVAPEGRSKGEMRA